MSRSLGVADSKADIDEGTITGITVFKTATGGTIGLYGKVPVVQRAYSSAVHASSALASSGSFGATQLAVVNEIQATLVALGIWAAV
jgi:hypothetical protein